LNKQVGGELGISEITVKAHRGQMMRKMKADSLPELVTMATRLGLHAAEVPDTAYRGTNRRTGEVYVRATHTGPPSLLRHGRALAGGGVDRHERFGASVDTVEAIPASGTRTWRRSAGRPPGSIPRP
jgi:hypothetical protein